MVICTAKTFLAKSACSSPSNRVLWFRGNYLFSFTTSILKDLETLTPMLGSVELQSLIASKGTLSFPGNWRYPVFWFHLPNGMVVTVASKTPASLPWQVQELAEAPTWAWAKQRLKLGIDCMPTWVYNTRTTSVAEYDKVSVFVFL